MKTGLTTLAGLALAVAVGGQTARAGAADPAESVKPAVLILLDTSGSMENAVGDAIIPAQEHVSPKCEAEGVNDPQLFALGDYPKSRLTIAKEVLTGKFLDYWCRDNYSVQPPDYGYAYAEPCSGAGDCPEAQQAWNGLLDIKRNEFKFALMTFDSGESTTTDEAGGWSYGEDKDGTNVGARNASWGVPNVPNVYDQATGTWTFSDADRAVNNVGQLIPFAGAEDFADLRQKNLEVQYEIRTLHGHGGTPLAPMLDDAKYFFLTDESIRPYDPISDTGDRYNECRPRTVILITDGRPSIPRPGLATSYPTVVKAVQALKDLPATAPEFAVKVFVVGYHLDADTQGIIDTLAPPVSDGLFYADSEATLSVTLAEIFGLLFQGTRSRTSVAYTNATRSAIDLQYQINAAFGVDPVNALNFVGYLNQTVYRCDTDCIDVNNDGTESCAREVVQIHERLNERPNSERDIRFVVEGEKHDLNDGTIGSVAGDKKAMEKLFDVPKHGQLPRVDPETIIGGMPIYGDPDVTIGKANDYANQLEYMKQLVSFLKADDDTMRDGKHMGAITHATPVVLEQPISGLHAIRSYNFWVTRPELQPSGYSPECRPTVAFTGTHDGQIHAFRIDRMEKLPSKCEDQDVKTMSEGDVGRELWSIVPQHLLKRSHQLVTSSGYLMDGQLFVADVLLARGDPTALEDEDDQLDEAGSWRSVLTAGYGEGGYGYIALDVTNPTDIDYVNLLWEIDPERRCTPDGCDKGGKDSVSNFDKLGLTTGRPAYGTAFIEGEEIAIAILPGGDTDNSGDADMGKVVYVVRLDNGEKIQEFSNDEGTVVDMSDSTVTLDYPITGNVAAFSDMPGVVTKRAFVGDAGGRLWRIDLSSGDPGKWRMQLFHDAYGSGGPIAASRPADRQPVMGAPSMAPVGQYGHLAVVYGVGHIDFMASTPTSKAAVYSLQEVTDEDGNVEVEENWVRVLEAGEELTGEPEIYARVAYFATYIANPEDACDIGEGRLYGLDFVQDDASGDSTDNSVGELDEDQDPSTIDKVKYVSMGEAIPYGVSVIERPGCLPGAGGVLGGANSGGMTATKGSVEVVVNIARGSADSPSTIPPGVDPASLGTSTFTHKIPDVEQSVQSVTWGYVLY